MQLCLPLLFSPTMPNILYCLYFLTPSHLSALSTHHTSFSKAGGTTVKQIYSVCYGLVKASGYAQPQRARALEQGGFQARKLEIISQPVNAKKHTNQANHNGGEQMLSYINFDLESPNERKLAKRVGLAESGMADFAITMGQVVSFSMLNFCENEFLL